MPDVPSGLAGLTDRVLPYLFPTADQGVFAATLGRSVGIETPPPQATATVATSFEALSGLARDGFFTPRAQIRTCVVVTDGETAPFATGSVGTTLGSSAGCRLVLVRIGNGGERVFRADGSPEANYRPAPDAAAGVERLATAAGGRAFTEAELAAAGAAVRSAASAGPRRQVTANLTQRPLAPWLAGGAALLVLGLVLTRLLPERVGRTGRMYDAAGQA